MDLSNQPIASPERPLLAPESQVAAPKVPVAAPQRRVVTSLGADMISSMQSLLGTVVIAIFVITFIVLAIARIMLMRLELQAGR